MSFHIKGINTQYLHIQRAKIVFLSKKHIPFLLIISAEGRKKKVTYLLGTSHFFVSVQVIFST